MIEHSQNLFSIKTEEQILNIKNRHNGQKIGFTCSCFDLLHSGHALMLKDAKANCDILVIALQTDPSIDRFDKNKPIQSYEERLIMLESIRYVDYIIKYSTESDLMHILQSLTPDVRILGSDWVGKKYTGYDLDIPIYFHTREHNYSTSNLRKRVYKEECRKTVLNPDNVSYNSSEFLN